MEQIMSNLRSEIELSSDAAGELVYKKFEIDIIDKYESNKL